jgi:hypothetical protein
MASTIDESRAQLIADLQERADLYGCCIFPVKRRKYARLELLEVLF